MLAFIPLTTFMQQLEDLFFLCIQKEKLSTALAVKKLQLKIMNHQQKENKKNTPFQTEDDPHQTQQDPPPFSSCIHSLPDTQFTEINVAEVNSPSRATSPFTQALTSPATSTSIMALPLPQPTTPPTPTENIQAQKTPTQQYNTNHKNNNHHSRPLPYNISSKTTSLKSPSPTHSSIDILTSKLLCSSTPNLYDILKRKKE